MLATVRFRTVSKNFATVDKFVIGTNSTCRGSLTMSVDWGRPGRGPTYGQTDAIDPRQTQASLGTAATALAIQIQPM